MTTLLPALSRTIAAKLGLAPLGSAVILKRLPAETTSKGGIVIPDIAQERPTKGVVLAVGPGTVRDDGVTEPVGVEPGDIVLYTRDKGTEVEVGGMEFTVVKGERVWAVERGDA